jgi:hypothetical protein
MFSGYGVEWSYDRQQSVLSQIDRSIQTVKWASGGMYRPLNTITVFGICTLDCSVSR